MGAATGANALSTLRGILTLISLVTVLFTEQIPRPLLDAIAMTYRYEWRALSYVLFLHHDYPPFEFYSAADGHEPHTTLAIPHYVVCLALAIAGVLTVLWAVIAVLVTGENPQPARTFLVGAYRYGLRVQAYVGLLTDQYPPFHMTT